jgi:glucan biosynthesis protein C
MGNILKYSKNNEIRTRAYYLDWVRVATIIIVFLFHVGRFFDNDDWHVKNNVTFPFADDMLFLLKEWMMPIFFFISGASTWFALAVKSNGKFAYDRVNRILVPLLLGIFILAPPQVYLERFSHQQFPGSFWQFMPHYFSGLYAFGGNFAWMGLHLWYLLLLFIFSFLLLPLFMWWKDRASKTGKVHWSLALIALIFLLAAPDQLLYLDNLFVNRGFGGWGILEHLVVFVAGYYFYARYDMLQLTIRYRHLFLLLTVILTSLNLYLFINHIMFEFGTIGYCLKMSLRSVVCFCWIFMILGFTAKYLNDTNRFLKYSNEAVLPFYILHQPLLLLIGYYIVRIDIDPVVKYFLISVISFIIVMGCYELIVKRLIFLRFLFGMGLRSKQRE